jgi:Putative transposase/Transposase zinc-binding domain
MKNKPDTLATVIDRFLPALNAKSKLPSHSLRCLDAIQKCRTPYMGGHVEACNSCGVVRTAYNSCRNRHCPQCGAIEKEKWALAREADLLPVKYFHVVFTVPEKLNQLFMHHKRLLYNLLFTTVWDVMKGFGGNEKWAGGQMGMTAILHTWGQNIRYHPHVHLIVPAGVLLPNGKWKHARGRGKYLFPVEPLSDVFRSKLVAALRQLHREGLLSLPVPNGLFDKPWVVFAKQPFAGPEQVIKYLSRYTHRTAISNNRILKVTDETVSFSWKDYSQNNKKQITSLSGEEFLRLFCQHISPHGYTRIRHYGFLSSASKAKSLPKIRASLRVGPPSAKPKDKSWQEIVFERMAIKPGVCKCCGGEMVIVQSLPNHFQNASRAPPKKMVMPVSGCPGTD